MGLRLYVDSGRIAERTPPSLPPPVTRGALIVRLSLLALIGIGLAALLR